MYVQKKDESDDTLRGCGSDEDLKIQLFCRFIFLIVWFMGEGTEGWSSCVRELEFPCVHAALLSPIAVMIVCCIPPPPPCPLDKYDAKRRLLCFFAVQYLHETDAG